MRIILPTMPDDHEDHFMVVELTREFAELITERRKLVDITADVPDFLDTRFLVMNVRALRPTAEEWTFLHSRETELLHLGWVEVPDEVALREERFVAAREASMVLTTRTLLFQVELEAQGPPIRISTGELPWEIVDRLAKIVGVRAKPRSRRRRKK